MRLSGIHHITAITGDAPGNVDFYGRVLGLRLVKKSVNQDDPTIYHLFYGDEHAQPGADLTFFEYPRATRGVAGVGMVHRIVWRVHDGDTLAFWRERLAAEGIESELLDREHPIAPALRFRDPEGLEHELLAHDNGNPPLAAEWHEVPLQHALLGFAGARAYSADPGASEHFLVDVMGFESSRPGAYDVTGGRRTATWEYDPASSLGRSGAGTVHHIAWWSDDDEHAAWQQLLDRHGAHPTPVIDRHYFRSIYYREPSGVLFELATASPGFDVDEPLEHLGERLSLPPPFEHLRNELAHVLTPLPNPRAVDTGPAV